MSDLRLAKNVQTMKEVGLNPSDPFTQETFDAFYDKSSDTVFLNLSSMWPADFVDWDAYIVHHVIPLLVHEHVHGTLYRLDIARGYHHWAIENMEG